MKMKLYEFGPTRSIRARWTLQELGADFEPIRVNLLAGEHRRPEFLKINPAAKIPVLVDGDLVLTESVAIVLYLAEKYSDKGLLPAGLKERGQVNRWLLFAATELEQPLWRISRHTALYPEEQRLRGDVILASGEFKDMASVLEKHMQGRQFVAGDSVSIADFVMAYTLDWGNEAKLLDGCPRLLAYMKRMYPARMRRRASPKLSPQFRPNKIPPVTMGERRIGPGRKLRLARGTRKRPAAPRRCVEKLETGAGRDQAVPSDVMLRYARSS